MAGPSLTSPFVAQSGTSFTLDGKPFRASGVNCYFLAYCSDESRRAAMQTARQMGAGVIRSWAFLATENYSPEKVAFQYPLNGGIAINDGPNGLCRLDALIQAAEDLGLKLILPLVNYWDALGGMAAYVKWLAPSSSRGPDVTDFYRLPLIRTAYRTWVETILTRRNTITGRRYWEEPAIMAWELTNEARCQAKGGRGLLLEWVDEMSTFVKQLDRNHLVALGDEGFFYKRGLGDLYDGSHGVDWEGNLALPNIDFGTYHFYPQDWGHGDDLDFAGRWIADHQSAANSLNKPAIMEEYGLRMDSNAIRNRADRKIWFTNWLGRLGDSGTAGGLLWMLGQKSPDTAGYTDGYVIYAPDEIPNLGETAT